MVKNYLKTAWMNLLRSKIYSFTNIAGLSMGLACAMLIMLYVKDEVSYDGFHKNVSHIYRIDREIKKQDASINHSSYTGYFQGPRFIAGVPEIQSFVRFQPSQVDVKAGADIQSQAVSFVDNNFFSVLTFPLISGDPKTALTQSHSVVITEEMAEKYFGSSDAVGKTITINSNGKFLPYTVTGIAKNCPQNSSVKFQFLLPLQVSAEDENKNENWFNSFLTTFVVLAPDADIKATQAKMDRVFQSDASETIKILQSKFGIKDIGLSYILEPLTDIHLGKTIDATDEILANKSDPVYSYILSGLAVFILLIACINFVNLTVARSVKRAKEIGIRKVVGGTRRQLMIQFLSESFILCFVAFSLAVYIALVLLPVFNQLSNKALALSYLFDAKLVTAYVALFIFTGLLAGFYPAAILSGYHPVQTLYSRFNLVGKNYLQKSLVIFQFALASFLIIATLTIFLQFDYLTTQKLGYDDTNLVTVEKWDMTHKEAALLKQMLLNNPNIVDVAPKNSGYAGNTVKVNGDKQVNVTVETIDASYLPLLKIPVVQGRNFSADFPSDSAHAVLVNETFAKQAGWAQPVGKQVRGYENDVYTVVGVVKDYHYKPLTEKMAPQLFTMNPNTNYGMVYIKLKPGTETASLQYIAKTFKDLFPLSAFAYNFKDLQNAKSYEVEARWKQILFFSAMLTIFISCIGLFGLSVLSAEKRTKEIGVRKVLGASVSSIVSILSADFLKLIFTALIISIPFAYIAANRWLKDYPYRITLDWWLFASSGILVLLIAMATISFQSIKAAIANPVKSLRTE